MILPDINPLSGPDLSFHAGTKDAIHFKEEDYKLRYGHLRKLGSGASGTLRASLVRVCVPCINVRAYSVASILTFIIIFLFIFAGVVYSAKEKETGRQVALKIANISDATVLQEVCVYIDIYIYMYRMCASISCSYSYIDFYFRADSHLLVFNTFLFPENIIANE